ncbi:hypothetical protein KP509_31G002800 [Ceratopteris richardii]|nr:hypothetical protein KP509_31G002800 [Ceratopteris richardii]
MVSWGECSRGMSPSIPPLHDRVQLAMYSLSQEENSCWSFVMQVKGEDDTGNPSVIQDQSGSVISKSSTSARGDMQEVESPNGLLQSNIGVMAPKLIVDRRVSDVEVLNRSEIPDSSKLLVGESATRSNELDLLVQFVFDLSASDVRKLKADAGEGFTSYEVICAHFWRTTTLARQAPVQSKTSFSVLANCRNHLRPPLSAAYFGNVISFSFALSTAGKVATDPLRVTAGYIHDLVLKLKNDIVSFMHHLETHGTSIVNDIRRARKGIKGHNVASSPRFSVYEVDFGWGKPRAVRSAKVAGEGELVFFGGRPEACPGDVEICTALPLGIMEQLLKDPLFLPKPTSKRLQMQG